MEESDCVALVAVVGGANRQEDPTSDVLLQPSGDTGNPDFQLDEGVGVVAQGLKGGEADDVHLGPCLQQPG